MHKLIATGLGIGYIRKGGGTVASLVCCGIWYILQPTAVRPVDVLYFAPLGITLFITAVGIWSANVVEAQWGKDSYRVVIDEVAGMCLSLLFIPINEKNLLTGLILFRLFDIAKPLGIRKLEKVRGGWGVMLDDLLAGLYTNILLQVAVKAGFL